MALVVLVMLACQTDVHTVTSITCHHRRMMIDAVIFGTWQQNGRTSTSLKAFQCRKENLTLVQKVGISTVCIYRFL